MSNPEDYAVGWICAISTEYVAALSLLDEKHDTPSSVAVHDNNDYTLGRIGKHNVVIAVLPDGEYGIASAASVARDMLHSFPNVRIGLMVGIGGGAPSPSHDIRLGDVVVSAPRDGMGGVFQYDFGKTIQNQTFQTTGFLNQPPMVLRTAMAGLRSQYESEGHQLHATIRDALDKKPRLRMKYSRPDQTSDRLYQSSIVHPINLKGTCDIVCGDEVIKLVSRPVREEDEDNPAIHYGLIASANQLMKDAVMRDTLAAEMNVLCFEMEAAGLMNQFPCLVIRGICDYSDSHKNKEWQGYAAMTAAAYAKDLLCRIPPNKVEAEQKIKDALSHVVSNIDYIKSEWDRKEDLEILEWITPINYGPQHSDFLNRRQPGTGQWLLDSAEYKSWLTEKNKTLFCPGIPGSGKTILTAIVVEDLRTRTCNEADVGLAYIYCNFRRQHEQGIDDLIACLVKQLSRKRPCLPDVIRKLHERHKREKTRPSLYELVEALRSVAATYSRIVIVLDALDECIATDRSRLRLLSYISSLRTDTAVGLFATSRHIPAIERELEGSLRKEVLASEGDMRQYIEAHMIYLPEFMFSMDQLKEDIRTQTVQAAQGMFLLLHLDLDSLKGTTSVAEVKSALERFSNRKHGERGQDGLQTALEQAYDEAMDRIDRQSPDQQRLARNALEWITCAKRPLSPLELQHALAVNPGGTAFDPENLREVDSIISLCAGLVTIDEESNVVRLVHYTTQKFFDRRQSQLFPGAETKLAVFCCQYLSNIAQSGNDYPYNSYSETLQLNPLYFYAGENWGHHARLMPEIPRSIQDFMTCQTTIQAAERALNLLRHPLITNLLRYPLTTNHLRFSLRSRSDIFPLRWNGLHLAAFFGICQALDFLSNNQHDLDLPDTANNTPLIYAVQSQHQEMARLLLQKGVTVNTLPSFGGPALDHAIANHDESMVSLLLENGADVNQEIYGTLPLLRAIRLSNASHLSDGITRLLIEKGAKITFSKEDRPLYEAAVCGHESLLELLWKEDDISTRLLDLVEHLDEESAFGKLGFFGSQFYEGQARVVNVLLGRFLTESEPILRQRLLFLAARHGCMDSLQLLLQQGVAVQSRGWQSRTTLSYAALGGNAAPVRFLLEEGSEIDAKDVFGRTPLSLAAGSSEDCRAAIEILLDEGAEIETRDDSGSTPLLRACAARKYKHQYGTIKMLLDRGAAVEAKDQTGSTPLMQACEGDRTSDDRYELIELLLDRGAATEARDKNGRTALMKAAHVSYARLLLDKGALIEATDDLGTTALMHAAWRLRLDVAKELLSRGAAVHARSKNGMTAISSVKPALSCRTMSPLNAFSIFKSLIDNGACVDERDIYGSTVLMGVARKGSASSIRFLLDQGADIKARDQSGLTALMHAAQVGNDYTVGELLDSGAAIEARDGWGQTPLMHAIGSLECMRKLLNRGAAIEARDGQGRTPLSSASYRGYLDCMKMLLDRGAKLDARDNDGKTALIYAVNGWREPSAAVATLLERGAALKARDNQGRTALSYAIMRREKRLIVQLLRANRKGRV